MSTNGTLILEQQECEGNYDFESVQHFMTKGFQTAFGEFALAIATAAIVAIKEQFPNNADYFQVFEYVFANQKRQKFYLIHDEICATFLLPDEY